MKFVSGFYPQLYPLEGHRTFLEAPTSGSFVVLFLSPTPHSLCCCQQRYGCEILFLVPINTNLDKIVPAFKVTAINAVSPVFVLEIPVTRSRYFTLHTPAYGKYSVILD